MPLVTCLCLTKNRREWLQKAIACFAAQSFRDAELLIVANGENVSDLVSGEYRVRLVEVAAPTIGAKRNAGIEHARGEIICHWDDDDHSAPGRLFDQVERLRESGKAVTGYNELAFTDGVGWWEYQGEKAWAFGTSLCYRHQWWAEHRFRDELNVGEDNIFVGQAASVQQLIAVPAGPMMYATIHEGNTSKRVMVSPPWHALKGFTWKDAA